MVMLMRIKPWVKMKGDKQSMSCFAEDEAKEQSKCRLKKLVETNKSMEMQIQDDRVRREELLRRDKYKPKVKMK